MRAAAVRARVEAALGPGFPSPFTFRERYETEAISSGVPELDSLTGGLPRGGLTEVVGQESSGRTSLLISALAAITARDEVSALVDAQDAFDPHSAQAAGVNLRRLLWVRCRNLEQALQAADLLLQSGGFGLVAVDLGAVAAQTARRVPLASWFRFRRAVENTPTVLIVLEQEPYAKTCASLVLRMEPHTVHWSSSLTGVSPPRSKDRPASPPHANLLCGARLYVEAIRSRRQRQPDGPAGRVFETKTAW